MKLPSFFLIVGLTILLMSAGARIERYHRNHEVKEVDKGLCIDRCAKAMSSLTAFPRTTEEIRLDCEERYRGQRCCSLTSICDYYRPCEDGE